MTAARIPESNDSTLADWEKEDRELEDDCIRVKYGITSENGSTRYNSKRDAELAFDKMLASWRDKVRKHLVKTIDPDSNTHVSRLRESINAMIETCCLKCGKVAFVATSKYDLQQFKKYYPEKIECNECNIKRCKLKHEAFKEWSEEIRKNPIKKYCNDIRDVVVPCEIPFERLERFEIENGAENEVRSNEEMRKRDIELYTYIHQTKHQLIEDLKEDYAEELKTGEMTRKQFNEILEKKWNQIKHKKRELREERKEYDHDFKFAYDNSPMSKYKEEILDKIDCECYSEKNREKMRLTGEVCKTCKLILKVREYTLNLFKDAAQGRSSLRV